MSDAPYHWDLKCAWCDYSLNVGPRGGRGRDQGAGFAAAAMMQQHTLEVHGKTWREYLNEPLSSPSPKNANEANQ